MIARAPSVGYIHEPFHLRHRPGVCAAHFDYWYTYICDRNAGRYATAIEACLRFQHQTAVDLKSIRHPHHVMFFLQHWLRFRQGRQRGLRPLLKDPLAFFSAEWLATRFNMDVIILIRHPLAFAGSLKHINWSHPFGHFLAQPLLMDRYLEPFRAELEEYASAPKDVVDQAILLWNLIHSTVLTYQDEHTDWHFVRHEDLARDPIERFRTIYQALGLEFTSSVQRKIAASSRKGNNRQARSVNDTRRDSRAIVSNWKQRLSVEEAERVTNGTAEIRNEFYKGEELT